MELQCESVSDFRVLHNIMISLISPLFTADSPYRTHINQALLKMQEEGKLHRLKTKWWVEKNTAAGPGNCDSESSAGGDTPELGLDNVGGVFLVLAAGLLVAIIVGILDFLWNIRSIAIEEKVRNYCSDAMINWHC